MRGLEGNLMAQPRVFGHDAATVIAGAINIRIPAIEAVSISVVGSGYDQSDVGDTLAQSGATTPSGGTGMQVNITEVSAAGTLQAVEIITAGSGYDVGNVITLAAATSGGTGAKLTVLADGLTLPGLATSDRGAVIYNGNAEQSVEIITEAGSNVVFPKVQPGTVVGDKAPMLAKGVISGSNLVAIY